MATVAIILVTVCIIPKKCNKLLRKKRLMALKFGNSLMDLSHLFLLKCLSIQLCSPFHFLPILSGQWEDMTTHTLAVFAALKYNI